MNLFNFLNRQKRWSRNTFGDAQRTEGILRHIEKEVAEIRQKPDDLNEWADVVILALDGAWRRGFTPHDICRALERKQSENMARQWDVPTSEDEPCEHVKEAGDEWCYDLTKADSGRCYMVAVCVPQTLTRYTLSPATNCGSLGWICDGGMVSGTVYAFREIPPLPEPPPLPEGWEEEN